MVYHSSVQSNKSRKKVDVRLSVIKPKHAIWVTSFFDKMQTERGREIVVQGWERSGIAGFIESQQNRNEDPFV